MWTFNVRRKPNIRDMLPPWPLILWTISMVIVYDAGADEYMQCGRSARYLRELPCDLRHKSWCVSPGHLYPWDQLKNFIKDNGALMRRMYGEHQEQEIYKEELSMPNVRSSRNRMMNFNHLPKSSFRKAEPDPIILSTSKTSSTTQQQQTTTTDELPGLTQMESSEDAGDMMYTTTADMTTQTEETRPETSQPTTEKPMSTEAEEIQMPPIRGVNACPVREEVQSPYWANNTRGELLALLNVYPFEQYVHWEKCIYQHKQMFCRDGCRCEQQYRLHRMLAFDPTNECRGIFSDWFKFPSCCVCKCYDLPRTFFSGRSGKMMDFDEETTVESTVEDTTSSERNREPITDNDTLDPTPKVKPDPQSLKDISFDAKWEDEHPKQGENQVPTPDEKLSEINNATPNPFQLVTVPILQVSTSQVEQPKEEYTPADKQSLSTHNMEGTPDRLKLNQRLNLSFQHLNTRIGSHRNDGYTAYSDPTNPEFTARNYEYQPPVRDPRKLMQRPTAFSFMHRLLRGNVTVQIPYSKIDVEKKP